MKVEEASDGNHEAEWEGEMGFCLVWFVEGVRPCILGLMVNERLLLLGAQDRELGVRFDGSKVIVGSCGFNVGKDRLLGKIVVVAEIGKQKLLA